MAKIKNKDQKILGYCALCGKKIRAGADFDLKNVGSRMKAVCKGDCDRTEV